MSTHVTRTHRALDGTESEAVFSDCGLYRYSLKRRWDDVAPLAFIMLNPSTADEQANDPTIARCEKRARQWGYGGVTITNLFAYRSPHPEELKRPADPVGPDNRHFVETSVASAGQVVAAWGVHGALMGQDQVVLNWLHGVPLYVLGLTKAGLPRHPLYVALSKRTELWAPAR